MEILIISGLSGAGKSKAASFLEDMGFYIVDNMPAAMILKFAEFCAGGNGRYDRVALVYDVRTASSFTELFDVLDKLKDMEAQCRMLFLEAAPEVIIKRYKETRRRHPLAADTDSLEEAVKKERAMMAPVKERADFVIDTSRTSTAQLRGELLRLFGQINEEGQTILMVTHSTKAASHAKRVLFIKDGEVFHQIYRGGQTAEAMYQKISDALTMMATGGERDA